MAIKDYLNGAKHKKELDKLNEILTPELKELIGIEEKRLELLEELDRQKLVNSKETKKLNKSIMKLENRVNKLELNISNLDSIISNKNEEIVVLEEEILMQSFGIYTPLFDFATSEDYKDRLKTVRDEQKLMVKNKTAAYLPNTWQVNGSTREGKKMINDVYKLLFRAFNNECDEGVSKVKFNNIESILKRIDRSYDQINKCGRVFSISINLKYKNLKREEVQLAHEYAQKKQEEKDKAREERERLREEEKLRKEIERETQKLKKEETHFKNALEKYRKQLHEVADDKKAAIEEQIAKVMEELASIEKSKADMDYRINNTRAGYVYVISNIGAFGKDVYKIGMTRRLEPTDRVRELGDASVPFRYDTHAMIFSNDAPKLENTLHKTFYKHRVNMVNDRREFFKVELSKIINVIKSNHNESVEFKDVPDAEEYRVTEKMRQQIVVQEN